MRTKYFDWSRGRPLDDRDGCPIEVWKRPDDGHAFGVHPAGFRVFLPADRLAASDEYRDDDPYAVARNLDSDFQQRRFEGTVALLRRTLALQSPPPRILDVGCGEGHITAGIRDAFPAAEISALDYSISAIEHAARRVHGVDFAVADAHEPPYAPAYFDTVVCNNLWEHVPDPLRLLAGMSRVLRPGGHLVLSTPSRYRLGNALRALLGRPLRFMSQAHVTEYSVGQVIEQLRYGGFEVVSSGARRVRTPEASWMRRSMRALAMAALDTATGLVGSHHSWEATVLYLARKSATNGEPDSAPSETRRRA